MQDFKYVGLDIFNASSEHSEIFIFVFYPNWLIIRIFYLNLHENLRSTYPSLRKNGIPGDFRFIIIHRVYYPESSDNRQQNLLMTFYALISKIGIDEPKALGLDTSMVVVERVPLITDQSNRSVRRITLTETPTGKRNQYDKEGVEMKYGRME